MKPIGKSYVALSVFGLTMGLMEAIIVVYLRALAYPDGFHFPLAAVPDRILFAEIVREACTMVMLMSLAWIASRDRIERLAFFLFSFGVWDIVYYIGLKLFLGWPDSLLAWDVLYLIPLAWLSPVLAPVLCSVLMIGLAFLGTGLRTRRGLSRLSWKEWALLLSGAFLIFWTFIEDYAGLVQSHGAPGTPAFRAAAVRFAPRDYNWVLFVLGAVLICASAVLLIVRKEK